MTGDVDETDGQTPDGVPCRHCGEPIFWDEICWVHSNGFADCGLVIYGGEQIGVITIDPQFAQHQQLVGKKAEPIGKWS